MLKFLVVDDDPEYCEMISDGLDGDQYFITTVNTLHEAIENIYAKSFDLVILNWHLANYDDSYSFLLLLKNHYRKIPLILISASFDKSYSQIKQEYTFIVDFIGKGEDFVKDLRVAVSKGVGLQRKISWLHLSDFHVRMGKKYRFSWNILKKALLKDLKEHQQLAHEQSQRLAQVQFTPDLLFITGDVAFSGQRDEYIEAGNFIQSVQDLTSLDKSRTFFVPGNHDTDREVATNRAIFTSAYKDLKRLGNSTVAIGDWERDVLRYWEDNDFRDVIKNKFEHYSKFVADYSDQPNGSLHYVQKLSLGATKIAIAGMSSACMCHKNGEDEEGGLWIGRPQIEEVYENLDESDFIFALIHHPEKRLHEYDQRISWTSLRNKANFILHGHEHEIGALKTEYPGGVIRVLLPGGSIYQGSNYLYHSYSYGSLDLDTKTVDLYFRKTAPNGVDSIYIRDNTTYPDGAPLGHVRFNLESV